MLQLGISLSLTPNSGLLAAGHFLSIEPRGAATMSGGSTGPEGSVFALPMMLIVALVINLTYEQKFRPSD
jgi:hypothetical protein